MSIWSWFIWSSCTEEVTFENCNCLTDIIFQFANFFFQFQVLKMVTDPAKWRRNPQRKQNTNQNPDVQKRCVNMPCRTWPFIVRKHTIVWLMIWSSIQNSEVSSSEFLENLKKCFLVTDNGIVMWFYTWDAINLTVFKLDIVYYPNHRYIECIIFSIKYFHSECQ